DCVTVGPGSAVNPERLTEGDYVRLEVSDTGRGMSLATQARVFDPFFTTKSAGHGLGLAVVQGIVRGLHGAIHIESAPGKGTTVQILLTHAEGMAEPNHRPVSRSGEAARPSQKVVILVVEDEGPLRQAVSKALHRAGFSVIEAGDGSGALEVIRAHKSPIDVLFLDITLPGTPSREVFDEAKHLRREMRVIVTSAYGEDLAAATLQAKIDSFVRKPYRLGNLIDLVRQTVS